MGVEDTVALKCTKHVLVGCYGNYEADTSVRMLLVEVIENQTQTGLSDKSVLLFIIKVQAQGTVQC